MRKVNCVLAVLLMTVLAFSQISCTSNGIFGGGGAAGITIGAASPGTVVSIDGRTIGTVRAGVSGPTAYVSPGMHTLTAKVSGYEPFSMSAYAHPGKVTTYELPLIKDMAPIR